MSFSFGGANSFGASSAAPSSAPLFGAQTSNTQASTGGSSLFGASTSSAPLFGSTSSAAPASGSLFGASTTSAAPASGSLFGSTSSAAPTSGSLFGSTSSAAPASGSLFGSTSSAAPASGSLFGSSSTSAAPASGSLFGSTSSAAPASGSLFGSSSTSAAPASGSLFGSTSSAAPASGSLFGSTSSAAPASGSLFGSSSTSAAPTSGSLFGSTSTTATTATTSAPLFGSTNTSAAATTTSAPLFGSTSTTTSGSLFGSTSATTTTAAAAAAATATSTGSLFGSAGAQPSGSSSLFGSKLTTAPAVSSSTQHTAPGTTTFGSSANPTATAAAAAATGPITRKTKFVDLPASVQATLEEIEKHKRVQIQIGSSILTDETEKELKQVSQTVQQLSHELHVVKMTMGGDRERVDSAKGQVNFSVKYAEKAAALVAHATDDGSWEQSGLTPLQVANRQRALVALQSGSMEGAPAMSEQVQQALEKDGASRPSAAVDAFEAVRRIQFASMHTDVASEYYWAWLSEAEASAQLLAERLDQIERHAAASLSRAQSGDNGAHRLTPKAVSDVVQYQNDSFIALAGRLAAIDDDVRKLKKKLAI